MSTAWLILASKVLAIVERKFGTCQVITNNVHSKVDIGLIVKLYDALHVVVANGGVHSYCYWTTAWLILASKVLDIVQRKSLTCQVITNNVHSVVDFGLQGSSYCPKKVSYLSNHNQQCPQCGWFWPLTCQIITNNVHSMVVIGFKGTSYCPEKVSYLSSHNQQCPQHGWYWFQRF